MINVCNEPCLKCNQNCNAWDKRYCLYYCQYIHDCDADCFDCQVWEYDDAQCRHHSIKPIKLRPVMG